jgi:hypothetical protein
VGRGGDIRVGGSTRRLQQLAQGIQGCTSVPMSVGDAARLVTVVFGHTAITTISPFLPEEAENLMTIP